VVTQPVEGWEHVRQAVGLYDDIIQDLFSLPGAAGKRRDAERPSPEAPHRDDLLCGCWRAPEAATALLELMGRHMEAIGRLSDLNPGFAMPACSLGRAAMEQGLRLAWLLDAATAEGREQHWLAFERENKRFLNNIKAIDDLMHNEIAEQINDMAERGGGERVPRIPAIETLAARFRPKADVYYVYRLLSQPIHGTTFGSETFHYDARLQWAAQGGQGEWIEAEFWNLPLAATWDTADLGMRAYRDLLAPSHPLPSLDRRAEFLGALSRVPPNYQVRRETPEGKPSATVGSRPNRAARRAAAKRRP